MKKNRLKVVAFFLALVLMAAIPYFEEAIPHGIGDVLQLFVVMAILTTLEADTLGVFLGTGTDYSDLIPRCIKTVIGVVMLLGLASIIKRPGWFSRSYFDNVIISQLPITLVDVCVSVIVGTTLYWAGGMAYDTIVQLGIVIGNICCRILRKIGFLELEDDEEERETTDAPNQGGDAV